MKKHLAVFILLCLILLGMNFQNVTVLNAESSETGEYEESIFMWVHPTGDVDLIVSFPLASAPINTSDFESDLSFLDLGVTGVHSLTQTMEGGFPPEVNNTYIFVAFNATIVSISEGKLKADTLKAKFEKLLNLTIPYLVNFSFGDRVMYAYSVDECPIQKFRDVLLEHKPSQGFGKLVTPTLIENYVGISFMLTRENGNLRWSEAMVYSYHYDYFRQ